MNETTPNRPTRRYGLFGPLLLITIGIIFLLSNFGVIQDSGWDMIWRLWPVILIIIGLDNIWKREGIVGATLLIGAGVVFLLGNFNLLLVNPWQVMISLWPVLLIAIGFDIIIGRRSALASLAGAVVVLVILAGALWMFGVRTGGGEALTAQAVSQALDDVDQAQIRLEFGVGEFVLSDLSETGALVAGSLAKSSAQRVVQDYRLQGRTAVYTLREASPGRFLPGRANQSWRWELGLTPTIPIDLTSSLGAGLLEARISELQLNHLKLSMGVGSLQVYLPSASDFSGDVSGGVGEIVIYVPDDVGVKIDIDAALTSVELPAGHRGREVYQSANYDSATHKINLDINLAVGTIRIVEQ